MAAWSSLLSGLLGRFIPASFRPAATQGEDRQQEKNARIAMLLEEATSLKVDKAAIPIQPPAHRTGATPSGR